MRDDMDMNTILENLTQVEALHRQARERSAGRDPRAAAESWVAAAAALRGAEAGIKLRLAEMLEYAAAAALQAGQRDAAFALAEEAAGELRSLPLIAAMPDLALRLIRLGQLLCAMQRWDAASGILAHADETLGACEDFPMMRRHAQALALLGTAHHFAGGHAEAIAIFERAIAKAQSVAGQTGAFPDLRAVAQLENSFGRTLLAANRPGAAADVLARAVANLDALVEIQPSIDLRNLLAATLNKLGHAQAEQGERAAASACLDRSVGLMRVLVEAEGQTGLAEDLQMAIQDQQRLSAAQPSGAMVRE